MILHPLMDKMEDVLVTRILSQCLAVGARWQGKG